MRVSPHWLRNTAYRPAIAADRVYAEAGLLMSYGPSHSGSYHRDADCVDRILKGAESADLPVEQPTRFELVINGKADTALRIAIPQEPLPRAEEAIE